MRVWLVGVGEPLPTDPDFSRPLRCGSLAAALRRNGHDVLWWTSTFDHRRKLHRVRSPAIWPQAPGYEIRLVHGSAYRSNVSFRRILNHRALARQFTALAADLQPPDILVSELPVPELSAASARFALDRHIPLVIDVQDLWPDIFLELIPSWLRALAKLAIAPMVSATQQSCRTAAAIVGNTDEYVNWGLHYAGRGRNSFDRPFPLAFDSTPIPQESLRDADAFWHRLGLDGNLDELRCCFFGTMGWQSDLNPVFRAAALLKNRAVRARFVLCGDGPRLDEYRRGARGLEDMVLFPGWVSAAAISSLMRICHVGLAPYRPTRNLLGNIPYKPAEYLSAGLPIIASSHGLLASLITSEDCGALYPPGDGDSLARVLVGMRSDPEAHARMSRNARRLFEQRFDARRVYADFTEHLVHIAHQGRSPTA